MASQHHDIDIAETHEKSGHVSSSAAIDGNVVNKGNNLHLPVSEKLQPTWRSYIWDSLDKSFIKFLDQVNVSSAFVSGMKEDLNLQGNQLNYLITSWTVGYVIGQIPSNMVITRVRPSIWIPTCEVIWSVLTIIMAKCTNVNQMYAIRFLVGLAESAFYPGMQYLLGSWYRKDELGKRSCILQASSFIGAMFSGYLMAATYNLGGVNGYKGWQWLFIIDTVISLPIAIAGFFILPDTPEITRAWWLSYNDKAIAKRRMELENRGNREPYSRAKLRKIFTGWHIYVLVFLYVLYNNNGNYGGQPGFQLWLKSEGYGVREVNLYPTIALAIAVVFALIFGWTSDSLFRGARWPPVILAGTANIVINVSLAVWDIPLGWKWACYMLGGLPNGLGAVILAWGTEICGSDNEERAFVVAAMNSMGSAIQAWLPLLIWKQVDAPRYFKGFLTMVFIAVALNSTALLTRFLQRREERRRERDSDRSESESNG
ncbi:MFS transporter Liz1/Seo1 [Pochonia chlamydosporia 170]|uniref:MFS transporter Liz1/Seo1 n=1 Tax=Pochonia chlamydosporia 170 TaxID=1380566 RepID=A0A179F2K8_METCM|nr:MFS transporter Liz1/Seo1 [Pochonia chlamydosporia 170]OAQ59319.1 MFS transporter Liz1/Seo1 [Pochonia chlamydosporia 170]